MRRLSPRLAGVVVLAGALLMGRSAAAQDCDPDHTITWPTVNPLWQICWVSPANSSGIDGSALEITSAYYNGKLVLARGHVPVINVKYDPGGCGGATTLTYRDWGNELAAFEANNVIRPGYAEPTTPPRTVCENPGDDIGTFEGVAVQKLPDRLILLSQIQAGWYRYIPEWTFFLDGTFQPGFRFTAVANTCTSLPHYHNLYWRLDFDIDGAANDAIDELNSGTWNTLTTEANRLHSPGTGRAWRIRDKTTGRGYELIPGPDADVAGTFSGADLWALAYRDTELDDRGATGGPGGDKEHIGRYITGEPINGGNVVAWYRAGYRHDGPADCEVAGPTLRPFETILPELSINDVSITEGDSGTATATFVVRLAAPATGVVTVNYATADDSASGASDYTPQSGTLTFTPGTIAQTVTVPIVGDTFRERTEAFTVNLSGATGAFIGDGLGEGTIVTDDLLAAGLVAAYELDEGSGTAANDASAGHMGEISGATWTTGKFGGALQFDGVDDMVTIADSPDFDLSTGMTIEAWVYPTAASGWRTVALKESSNGLAYALYAHDGAPRSAAVINTGGDDLAVRSPGALPVDAWSHVAATYDGSTMRFYRDGTEVGTRAAAGGIISTAGALRFGGNMIWGDEFFAGKIDEVRIYNRPLSAAEIASDMNTPVGIPPPADTTPPTTMLTAPANNAVVRGPVIVSATVSDDVAVASVQFLLDGQPLGAPVTLAPYFVTWDTALSADGPHVLTARAVDAMENRGISPATNVVVDNATPPVPWVVPSGLVAAYTFSEGAGTTTADASGGGNVGTISGATWTPGGRFGNALSFDGINDWVTVDDDASLDLTNAMTIEAWVYPTALSGWRTVALKEAPSGLAYSLYANDNVPMRPAGYVNLSAADVAVVGTSALPLNTWTHLAMTYSGDSLRLFVNGMETGAVALTGNIRTTAGTLRIGGNSIWSEWFSGRIDEVRIYNRALTPAEIVEGMYQTLGP